MFFIYRRCYDGITKKYHRPGITKYLGNDIQRKGEYIMAGTNQANDGRNYTIDLLRVIAAVFMACWHWIWLLVFPGEVNGGYWGAYLVP